MDAKHMGEYGWKWMSGSSTRWHDEMNHTYSKEPDWAGYQNWSTTMDQQKNMIKIWLSQFCCELQLKPVHWPTHSLLALASLHPSQGVRTSPPLYRGTCTSEHSGDTIDGQSSASVWYGKWIHKYIQIYTGLPWTVSSTASSHPTCHPDPTADAPMPLILAPSWHSFRGFGLRRERSATLPLTQ